MELLAIAWRFTLGYFGGGVRLLCLLDSNREESDCVNVGFFSGDCGGFWFVMWRWSIFVAKVR